MKKISIYVHNEVEGSVDKVISKLVDILCDNNVEVVNIKQEELTHKEENEALNFRSDDKGCVIDYPIIITEEIIKQVQESDFTMPKIKGDQFIVTNDKEREFAKNNKIPIPIDYEKIKEIANKLKDK